MSKKMQRHLVEACRMPLWNGETFEKRMQKASRTVTKTIRLQSSSTEAQTRQKAKLATPFDTRCVMYRHGKKSLSMVPNGKPACRGGSIESVLDRRYPRAHRRIPYVARIPADWLSFHRTRRHVL